MLFLEVRVNSVINAKKAEYKEIGAPISIRGRIFLYIFSLQTHFSPQVFHLADPKVHESSTIHQKLRKSAALDYEPEILGV